MTAGRFQRVLAAAAIPLLLGGPGAQAAGAGSLRASWSGRVIAADRSTPRAGVVVGLVDGAGAYRARSLPTRADGAFAIDDVPPGTFGLRVEAPEGVFVSSAEMTLAPGTNAPMALALGPGSIQAKREQGLGSAEVSRTTEYIFAGAVTLLGLFVIFEITGDENETDASVF